MQLQRRLSIIQGLEGGERRMHGKPSTRLTARNTVTTVGRRRSAGS